MKVEWTFFVTAAVQTLYVGFNTMDDDATS